MLPICVCSHQLLTWGIDECSPARLDLELRFQGSFVIGRKTIKKRMVRQLQAIKMELRRRMHDSIAGTGAWVRQMLKGHLNYYAVPGTIRACGGSPPRFGGAD